MKHPLYLSLIVLFGTGSAEFLSTPYTIVEADYTRSNQIFLDATLRSLNVGELVKSRVPVGSTVALISLDGADEPQQLDQPLAKMLEDRMMGSLLEQGVIVLDRDEINLHQFLREKSGQNLSLSPGQWKEAIRQIPAIDSAYKGPLTKMELLPTHLRGADYLVSYRVEEMGLLFREIADSSNLEQREARARLFLRIEDVKTGQILYADNIESSRKDRIHRMLEKHLADFHYAAALHEYPLTKNPLRTQSRIDPVYEYEKPGQIAYFNLQNDTRAGALDPNGKIHWDNDFLFGVGVNNFLNEHPHLGYFYSEMNAFFRESNLSGEYPTQGTQSDYGAPKAWAFTAKANYGRIWYPWPTAQLLQLSLGALAQGEFSYSSLKMSSLVPTVKDSSNTGIGYGVYPVAQVAAEIRWRGNFVFRAGLDYAVGVGIGSVNPGLGYFFRFGLVR